MGRTSIRLRTSPVERAAPATLHSRGRRASLACIAVLALLACCGWRADAQVTREYDLKAVFLYNLASFVQWPKEAFSSPTASFVIGVVGDDPFGRVLEDVVSGEYLGNHPFEIKRYRRVGDIDACHVLFVSGSEARRIGSILAHVRGKPVLTVGDTPGFAEAGGMIGFTTEHEHLQLYVNAKAARACALDVSSKLLEVARVVGDTVAAAP